MQSTTSTRRLLRLGLFQFGAGMVSVLLLGILNRVLRVELGMDLFAVGVMLGGGHYLGALVSIPVGYLSDHLNWRGYHRLPFLFSGTLLIALTTILAPFVGLWVAAEPGLGRVAFGFAFFVMQGISTYVAGTVYLSLITDLTDEGQRGPAVGLIWTLLMFGILGGVGLGVTILANYSFQRLIITFASAAIIVLALAAVALWKQEQPERTVSGRAMSLGQSLRLLWASRQTRIFFIFLVIGLFSHFMQDVILEPFGAEVFGMSVSQTTRFNAYYMAGTLSGILGGGLWWVKRWGKKAVTRWGALLQIGVFSLLAFSSVGRFQAGVIPGILLMGFGMGLFTVGGVSLMMDMTLRGQAGLFAGAWTLAMAVARGPAAVISSGLQSLLLSLTGNAGVAYGAVFLIEALGFVAAAVILADIVVSRFRQEVRLGGVLYEAVD
ncbi:MAG: BCD family MFS transporter [Anaerolineae bacterium]